ncbi:MAG: ankyrin repeat domain-containing protein [Alphaproteobacteria bacterium]|nr:ankyrin repeat domain-containing protein [Alphaproteobacteria bacterium]
MNFNFRTLCACLALVAYSGTATAGGGDRDKGKERPKKLETLLKEAREELKNLDGEIWESESQNDKKQRSKSHIGKRIKSYTGKKMSEEIYNEWMDAVYRGDIKEVSSYIDQNYEVDAHYPGRWSDKTALERTAYCNNKKCIDILKLLLEKGANPSIQALGNAVYAHRPDAVELLLEKGADPNIYSEWRDYPLIATVRDTAYRDDFTKEYSDLLKIIELLIKYGANKNVKDEDGKTALMIAKEKGETKVAKLLLKEPSDLNAESQNDKKQQAESDTGKQKMSNEIYDEWMEAVSCGDIDEVRSYIDQNYDVNAHYPGGYHDETALECTRSIDMAKLLLENGADPNIDGGKAIRSAIIKGTYDKLKLLLEKGADPNIRLIFEKVSPLSFAIKLMVDRRSRWSEENETYLDLLKKSELLIKHGADKNVTDRDGNTTLMLAAEKGKIKLAKLLLKKSNLNSDLNVEVIDLLLSGKNNIPRSKAWISEKSESVLKAMPIDINAQDKYGCTALMLAANNGHYGMVQLLLEHGADVNIKSNKGNTALMAAVVNRGRYGMLQLLLEHGADPNIRQGSENDSPLIFVIKRMVEVKSRLPEEDKTYLDMLKMLELLIKHGADKNVTDKDGKTALMLAAEEGKMKIAKLLLKKPSDLNVEVIDLLLSGKNNIPGSKAWISEKSGSVLKAMPINVNAQDKNGRTALMSATDRGHYEMVQLLLEHGADVSIKNKRGGTVLDCAKSSGNDKIVGIVKDAIEKLEEKAKATK